MTGTEEFSSPGQEAVKKQEMTNRHEGLDLPKLFEIFRKRGFTSVQISQLVEQLKPLEGQKFIAAEIAQTRKGLKNWEKVMRRRGIDDNVELVRKSITDPLISKHQQKINALQTVKILMGSPKEIMDQHSKEKDDLTESGAVFLNRGVKKLGELSSGSSSEEAFAQAGQIARAVLRYQQYQKLIALDNSPPKLPEMVSPKTPEVAPQRVVGTNRIPTKVPAI